MASDLDRLFVTTSAMKNGCEIEDIKKWDMRQQTRFNWLKTGSSGRILQTQ
jgi:hypothetical protein